MTDMRELIERGRYTAEHGVFDAVDACKYATVAELTDALTAALEREEALRAQIKRIIEENIALRCIAGGGCYANDDGQHLTIIGRGKERFCNDCGDNVNSHGKSKPWFDEERLERAVQRNARAALNEEG